jgi:hypothetical protein
MARLEEDDSWRDLGAILGVSPSPRNRLRAPSEVRSANLALLFGILSWTIILFFLSIPAVIFGHKALAKARVHPNKVGRRRAIAGLSLGFAQILLFALAVIFNKQIMQSNALDALKKRPELLPQTAILVKDVLMRNSKDHTTTVSRGSVVAVSKVTDDRVTITYENQTFPVPIGATDIISRIAANGEKLKKEQEGAQQKEEAARPRHEKFKLGPLFGLRSSVEIDGDQATITIPCEVGYSLDGRVYDALRATYSVARDHADVKRIVVKFIMRGEGLIDKYGNKVEDYEMGQTEFDGDEVRKYVKDYAFTQGDQKVTLEYLLRSMPGSEHLK